MAQTNVKKIKIKNKNSTFSNGTYISVFKKKQHTLWSDFFLIFTYTTTTGLLKVWWFLPPLAEKKHRIAHFFIRHFVLLKIKNSKNSKIQKKAPKSDQNVYAFF
jgi:hypothetical protein